MEDKDFNNRFRTLFGNKIPEGAKIISVQETVIGPSGEQSTTTTNINEAGKEETTTTTQEGTNMADTDAVKGTITIIVMDNDTDQVIQANVLPKAAIGAAGQLGVPIAFAQQVEDPSTIKEAASKVANGATTVAKAAVVGAETAGKGVLGALAAIKQGLIDAGEKYDERQAERAQKRLETAQKIADKLKCQTKQ